MANVTSSKLFQKIGTKKRHDWGRVEVKATNAASEAGINAKVAEASVISTRGKEAQ